MACNALMGCGDDDDSGGGGGGTGGTAGSSSAGTAGKNTGGSKNEGGTDSKGGSGGSDTAGTAGTAGSGNDGGAPDMGGSGGMAGMGGMVVTPECTKDADCLDDLNPCTDEKCTDGKCAHPNNTATCDDNNGCTDNDKCDGGSCKGTNTTAACDDLSSCTSDDKCKDGACIGTNDAVMCPACASADNLVKNCDFSMGTDNYQQSFDDGASGSQTVVNGRLVVDITAGGTNLWSIQPRQEGLSVKKGMKYKLHFLAGASVARKMFVGITQNHDPYAVYSDDGYTIDLAPQMKPFDFTFTVTKADDANMKLEIRLGTADWNAAANSVYFDDFSLVPLKCTDAPSCDDGNVCTTETCDADGICHSANNTVDCATDNDPCTNDVCAAGACTHPAGDDDVACAPDADDCTADLCKAGKCDHSFSSVLCPACRNDGDCDDTNDCTDDKCDTVAGTCTNTNNVAACDDKNTCTTGDVCAAGKCGGTNTTDACDDADPCTLQDMCAAGVCGSTTNVCFDCTAGGNLLTNCNLSDGTTGWLEGFFDGGAGTQSVENGMLKVNITNGSDAAYKIQPRQEGLVLAAGVTYVVKFNAMASIARGLQMSITKNGGDYFSYSTAQTFALTTEMQQFSFEFTMIAPDPAFPPKFEFDLGGAANNPSANIVYLDNLSIAPKP